MGRGASLLPVDFCPLLKISLGNPYLKILGLLKLFVANTPMKKKFTPFQSTIKIIHWVAG